MKVGYLISSVEKILKRSTRIKIITLAVILEYNQTFGWGMCTHSRRSRKTSITKTAVATESTAVIIICVWMLRPFILQLALWKVDFCRFFVKRISWNPNSTLYTNVISAFSKLNKSKYQKIIHFEINFKTQQIYCLPY